MFTIVLITDIKAREWVVEHADAEVTFMLFWFDRAGLIKIS